MSIGASSTSPARDGHRRSRLRPTGGRHGLVHSHLLGLAPQDFADADLQIDFESLYVNAESGKVVRTEWLSEAECQHAAQTILHLFVEVTRIIEQQDFEGWLKNRLLGGS